MVHVPLRCPAAVCVSSLGDILCRSHSAVTAALSAENIAGSLSVALKIHL